MCFSYLVELSKVCSKSYIACSLYVLAMINRTKKLLKVSCMQVMDVIIVCVLVSWSWYKCISSHTFAPPFFTLPWKANFFFVLLFFKFDDTTSEFLFTLYFPYLRLPTVKKCAVSVYLEKVDSVYKKYYISWIQKKSLYNFFSSYEWN